MKNVIYLAESLDGFIAREDGSIDWLMDISNPDNSDFGFSEFLKNIDAIIMGRNTFEKVLSFGTWPYTNLVFVLSNKLKTLPEKLKGKAEVIKGNPFDIVESLQKRDYYNLYIDGGKTVQAFLKHGLIDEMIISRIPILLGSGIPLFGKLDVEQRFKHIKTDIYNNTIVKSYYRKVRK